MGGLSCLWPLPALGSGTKCQKPSFSCSVIQFWCCSSCCQFLFKVMKYVEFVNYIMQQMWCAMNSTSGGLNPILGIFLDTIATLGMNDRTGGMIGIIIGYSVTNRWVCRLGCVYQCRTRGSWLPSPFPASSAPSSSCPPPAHHNAQTPQTCPLFIVKFHTFLSYV